MTYGGSVPTITPSYSGFVNGDNATSLSTQAGVQHHGQRRRRRWATTPSSCSGAADSNYTISYVSGLVAVEPGAAVDHGLVGLDDLRRLAAGHHCQLRGLRERPGPVGARGRRDLHDGGHRHQPGGVVRVVVQRGS